MEDSYAKKKLPYNLNAEKSVIGSMLMDRDAIVDASDMLTKEDFYYGQYGILFENMVELFKEGKAVDIVTLKNKLEENNVPDEVISISAIADIMDAVPTSVNAKHYAEIVADKSVLRKTIKLCEEVEKDCIWIQRAWMLFWREQRAECSTLSKRETVQIVLYL